MNETIMLAGGILFATIVFLIIRVPASIAFLSLLIGQLLAQQTPENFYELLKNVNHDYVQAGLLVTPLLLTILVMRGRLLKHKILIEFLPMLLVVSLLVILLSPYIHALDQLLQNGTQGRVNSYKNIIVISAGVSGLLSAWLSYPRPPKDHKKH